MDLMELAKTLSNEDIDRLITYKKLQQENAERLERLEHLRQRTIARLNKVIEEIALVTDEDVCEVSISTGVLEGLKRLKRKDLFDLQNMTASPERLTGKKTDNRVPAPNGGD